MGMTVKRPISRTRVPAESRSKRGFQDPATCLACGQSWISSVRPRHAQWISPQLASMASRTWRFWWGQIWRLSKRSARARLIDLRQRTGPSEGRRGGPRLWRGGRASPGGPSL